MESMTIGEAARKAGVEASTLRYYESIGLLPPTARSGGQRRYSNEVLTQLQVIGTAKEAGFTLAEISTLLGGFSKSDSPSERWKRMARKKIIEVDALIRRAEGMKRLLEEGLACDCLQIEECEVLLNRGSG